MECSGIGTPKSSGFNNKRNSVATFSLYRPAPPAAAKARTGASNPRATGMAASAAPSAAIRVAPKPLAQPTPSSRRALAPAINHTIGGRACFEPLSDSDRRELLQELEEGVLAASSRSTFEAQLRTWERLHLRRFGDGVGTWPLSVDSLRAVTAQLKGAGFRSAPGYVSAAKRRHVELGFEWTAELTFVLRDCLSSTQ